MVTCPKIYPAVKALAQWAIFSDDYEISNSTGDTVIEPGQLLKRNFPNKILIHYS